MVKLMYFGAMSTGIHKLVGTVQKGKVYEVADVHVDKLMATGEWKKVDKIVEEKPKKIKKRFLGGD